jgi:hypothetical protein
MYNVGCTFVDWSILYLSGQTHYCHANTNEVLELPASPLTKTNAHLYRKNHPHGMSKCLEVVDILQQQKLPVTSFYPGPPVLANIQSQLGYTNLDLHNPVQLKHIFDQQYLEYQAMIECFFNQEIPVVYVAMDPSFSVFTSVPRGQDKLSWSGLPSQSLDASHWEFHEVFYHKDNQLWESIGCDNIWDQRERLALEMRPLDIAHPNNTNGFAKPHFWIDSRDLWYRGDQVIPSVLEFLNLSTDKHRLEPWYHIYHAWRSIANKNIQFMVNLDHMVNAIVMGWYYPLPDLELFQEAVIQHCLIYQHNLNLKTWGLVRFPNNTQALHDLLESNIHQLN